MNTKLPVEAIVLPSKVKLSTFHSLTFLLPSTVTTLFATIVPFAEDENKSVKYFPPITRFVPSAGLPMNNLEPLLPAVPAPPV